MWTCGTKMPSPRLDRELLPQVVHLDTVLKTTRFLTMERVIQIFPSHRLADEADRKALSEMSPQERLDRAVALQAHYREAHGDIGQGLARVARIVPRDGR